MNPKKIYLVLTLAVIATLSAITSRAQSHTEAAAQSGGILDVLEQRGQAQAQQIEGTWTVTVTPILPPGAPPIGPFTVYTTFARGGVFIGTDSSNVFSHDSNPQLGVWEHRGGNSFAFTFKQVLLDAMGKFTGILSVDALLTVNGKDSFVGVANGELRDARGNLIMTLGCGTMKGERMKIGSLANQCQTFLPPQ